MIYSKLIKEDIGSISMHAEQVYNNFKKFIDNNGIFDHELTLEPIESISKWLTSETLTIKSIILDFHELDNGVNVGAEFISLVNTFISKGISVCAIRICDRLYGDLKINKLKISYNSRITETTNNDLFSIFIDSEPFETKEYDNQVRLKYEELFASKLKDDLMEDNPKKHSNSSNVYLPKYINIKKFIEGKDLLFFGLYLLCSKAITDNLIPKLEIRGRKFDLEKKKSIHIKTPILFYQSLNGAYIASILAKLAVLDLAYIDHIGPINKIYQTVLKTNFKADNDYLIISDVVCMGTEIQIAKNLIEFNKSEVKGGLSLVKINVINGKSGIISRSLYNLSSEKNKEIGYKIETEF